MIAGIGSGTVNQLAHVVEQAAEGCPQGLRMQKITSQIGEQTPLTGKIWKILTEIRISVTALW